MPGGSAGEDWAWTDQGDAFVFGSGGSRGGGAHSAPAGIARFASIAAAGAGVPALGKREREAHDVAQAFANGSLQTVSDGSGRGGLFASLFGNSPMVGGPNTAVAMMIGLTVLHFAGRGSPLYVDFVLALSLMVGLIQLVIWLLRGAEVFRYFSPAAITGIKAGVGVWLPVSSSMISRQRSTHSSQM